MSTPGILAAISAAFRQNLRSCLVLNLLAAALVVGYYQVSALADMWRALGDFKTRWSFGFSSLSTIFAAVLLPTLIQWAQGVLPPGRRLRRAALLTLFWGWRGMEIDLFYRFQTWLFGAGSEASTLLKKVLFDQFVASPLWFVPTYVLALRWVEMDGSFSRTLDSLDRDFWTRTCPTVLLTNWLVWIPALALVYSLPSPLQFPLFSVVMCFFILIVTVMARHRTAA